MRFRVLALILPRVGNESFAFCAVQLTLQFSNASSQFVDGFVELQNELMTCFHRLWKIDPSGRHSLGSCPLGVANKKARHVMKYVTGPAMVDTNANDFMWRDRICAAESARVDNCCLFDFGYYPVMVEWIGRSVRGQLVHVDKEQFAQVIQDLDYLEGFNANQPQKSNFRRVRIPVNTHDGDRVFAWTYLGQQVRVHTHPLIASGDWAKYITGKDE